MQKLKSILVNLALRILKMEVLGRIDSPTYNPILAVSFSTLEGAARLVTDGDPDDKAQLAALWQEQKKPIFLGALDTAKAVIVEEIKDDRTESYLVILVDELREAVADGGLLKLAA